MATILDSVAPRSLAAHSSKSWVPWTDYIPQSKGGQFLRLKLQDWAFVFSEIVKS